MGWKQCSIPLGRGYGDIQEQVSGLSMANGDPAGIALFARSGDASDEVLLLSPDAVAAFGDALPPTWTEEPQPNQFGWSLLFGHADSWARFGLKTPREMGDD